MVAAPEVEEAAPALPRIGSRYDVKRLWASIGHEHMRALGERQGRAVIQHALSGDAIAPAVDAEDVPSRPSTLLDFVSTFRHAYVAMDFHATVAGMVDHALNRDCRFCLQPRPLCTGDGHSYAALDRLIITTPPQIGKTEIVSVAAPAYYLGEHPDRYWAAASYSAGLAERAGRFSRGIVQSEAYQQHYSTRLDPSKRSMTEWEVLGSRGGFLGVGIGGGLTGRPVNVIVIDDPLKSRQEADSPVKRASIGDWWTGTVGGRIGPDTIVIIVMTRWHYDDLVGRVVNGTDTQAGEGTIDAGGRWRILRIPAIADAPDDPLGRAIGDPLMSGPRGFRFQTREEALAWWHETRKRVGEREWTAQYQGSPGADEGAILRTSWFGWYDPHHLPASWLWRLHTWDTAYTEKTANDASAMIDAALSGQMIYLLDGWRGRLEFPDLINEVATRAVAARPSEVKVENKATGISIVQTLRLRIRTLSAWDAEGADKIQRAYAAQEPLMAAQVLLPRWRDDATGEWVVPDWVRDLMQEVMQFPAGAHDDYVDALTMALILLNGRLKRMERDRERQRRQSARPPGIDARYIDSDTQRVPSAELVRPEIQW